MFFQKDTIRQVNPVNPDLIEVAAEAIDVANGAVERGFETSPDSVYGVLVGVLLVFCFLLFFLYYRANERNRQVLIDALTDNNTVLRDIANGMQGIQQGRTDSVIKLADEIDHLESTLVTQITHSRELVTQAIIASQKFVDHDK